ncbi:MAG: hypothetical protein ACFFBP_19375 [Promethearchaeota archaeon]
MIEIENVYNLVCIILGLLVIGEATALLIGMNLAGTGGKEWLSIKNYIILIFDIMTGLLIIPLIMNIFDKNSTIFLVILLISIFILHLYRDIEYFMPIINKFCINFPLFVFNNIKLILSLFCIGINIYILITVAKINLY